MSCPEADIIQTIRRELYPTGLNPKEPSQGRACFLITILNRLEKRLPVFECDGRPKDDPQRIADEDRSHALKQAREINRLANIGPRLGKRSHIYHSFIP